MFYLHTHRPDPPSRCTYIPPARHGLPPSAAPGPEDQTGNKPDHILLRFYLFEKIILSLSPGINKVSGHLQIPLFPRNTIQLNQCQLNFLVSGIAVYLPFFRAECPADKIRELRYNIKKLFLACGFIVRHCRFDHMAGSIQLMSFRKIGPAQSRFLDCEICIQISVRLLGPPDQIYGLVCQFFQFFISLKIQYKADCLQPLCHVCILKNSPVILALFFSRGNPEIFNAVTRLYSFQIIIENVPLVWDDYIFHQSDVEMNGVNFHLELSGDFPWKNQMKFQIRAEREAQAAFYFRIPAYAREFTIRKDGQNVEFTVENGYAKVEGSFRDAVLEISFEVPAEFVHANPQVRADSGKTALVKGPLVYCLEEADNGSNLASVFVQSDQEIQEVYESGLLGGCSVLKVPGNRDKGEMLVWVKELLK